MTISRASIAAAARVLFVVALIVAVVFACLPQPPQLPTEELGDKFHHVLAFAVLSALAALGWPAVPRWRMIEHLSFLGALIEVVQAIPALQRDCDIRDWIADTLAIMVVTGLAALLSARKGANSAH